METQFDLPVDHVTKKEFVQAGSELVRGMAAPMLIAVAVVTVVIMMFLGDYSLRSLLPPFLLVFLGLLVFRLMVGRNYRHFPKDTQYSFLIDDEGWQISVGDDYAVVDWQDTAKLVVRSHVVLLYNEDNRSNLLPRRCVTDGQIEQLQVWFKASRPAYQARQRIKAEEWKKEHRRKREQARRS